MVIIDLFRIVDLKEKINEKFGIKMHVHDGCSLQSFSFDEGVRDEVIDFVKNYFAPDKYQVIFSPDKLYFHLEK